MSQTYVVYDADKERKSFPARLIILCHGVELRENKALYEGVVTSEVLKCIRRANLFYLRLLWTDQKHN